METIRCRMFEAFMEVDCKRNDVATVKELLDNARIPYRKNYLAEVVVNTEHVGKALYELMFQYHIEIV